MISLPGSNTSTCKSSSATASRAENTEVKKGKRHIPSASTALILGSMLGLLQAIFLVFGAKILLGVMGVKPVSVSIINTVSFPIYLVFLSLNNLI